jgi:ligand-binding sensor domain-containing protein
MYYGSPIINGNIISENHCVGMASTPDGKGYWLVTSNGTVLRYGDAKLYGMMGNKPKSHCVGMASTPDGKGYWLVTSAGVVRNFGDAISLGSEPASATKNTVIVGMASTPDGKGYWLTAASGQVYRFGDAENLGSVKTSPKDPVVGMAISPNGKIFQQATQLGNVYTFTASIGYTGLSQVNTYQPIVGFVPASKGMGDWLVDELGNSFTTGNAAPYDLG